MARISSKTLPYFALAVLLGAASAVAQVGNPAEQQQGEAKSKDELGKSKLGGTMPPNGGVPAMTPGAQQPASAGTTTGPDGTMTRNSDTATGAAPGSTSAVQPSPSKMAK